ncbi:MAG: hypothetical protein IK139_02275 [Lachnospiraceae bacterium]|nr:hypothetical protein [Lachnospiraceae bacterium]
MDESSMFGKADSFLDYVIIGAGIYLIYAGVIMKVAGRIPKSLISRNIDVENAPNKDEYINNMFLPCIVLGIIMAACGASTWILPGLGIILPEKTTMVTSLISMAIVILFGIFSMNMQKKYLSK